MKHQPDVLDHPIVSPRSMPGIGGLQVNIAATATAVPKHVQTQDDVKRRAMEVSPHLAEMISLYLNTGIDTRHTVFPADWYHHERSWPERTKAFQENALELLEKVARESIAKAGLSLSDIDGLVINTITGLAVPSLDAMLMNRMDFRTSIDRLPIFGFGCGGGVAGLSTAARMAQSLPDSTVLFLTVDLCSLCLRVNDPSIAMFVSAALFGDGAAAVVLQNFAGQNGAASPRGEIIACGQHFWPDTEQIMGWDVMDDGFGVVLSPELISLTRDHFRSALDGFLERSGLSLDDFDGFLFHPGGRRVLENVETVIGLDRAQLDHSWSVLRNYGNMSSATAMFILNRAIEHGASGRHLVAAFGPGFSAYFLVVDL